MLVVLVSNGAAAIFKRRRTDLLVEEALDGLHVPVKMLSQRPWLISVLCKGMVINQRIGRMRKFIMKHNSPENTLLCVGKSLGARNIAEKVLNPEVGSLKYRKSYLLTIDPCWPTRGDITPNLNDTSISLRVRFTRSTNIYVEAPPEVQAGARVRYAEGIDVVRDVRNEALRYHGDGVDHFNVIEHGAVMATIWDAVRWTAK